MSRHDARGVYTMPERAGAPMRQIGLAWTNRDGSVTVRLDALPLTGVMMIRDLPVAPPTVDVVAEGQA